MMTRIQTRLTALLTAALLTAGATAQAQEATENHLAYPFGFVSLQGGGQVTFTDYNNWKLITPTASVSAGMFFTPVVGARLHFNGLWDKGGIWQNDYRYSYKYLTSDLDLMLNLVNLFTRRDYSKWNVYLIGGVGLTYAWNNDDAWGQRDFLQNAYEKSCLSHNFRVGAMLDYNVARNWSVNLEVAGNSLSDRFNSKIGHADDWMLTAQLGVTFKFGKKAKKVVKPEVWETRVDTIWYDDAVFTPHVEDGKATWNVFYKIRESDFEADEQLAAIGAFLKDHRECKVDIKSYADVETGNPKINMEYSKQRCEKAVKALTDAGVPASSITSAYYGDTVQPFAENDKNRVTIIVASGLKDINEKNMVKKFKTKEVRYRVE
ncbi:MAG: outer membrane beta-barrel protein [Bacteroidaceae bacterium]|nr:outer membrane beta-barrel protein [Bacteroidaceae bacterium]